MGKLPEGWAWARVGQICEINPREWDTPGSVDEQVSFIPMTSVEAETGLLDASQERSWGELEKKSYTKFHEGDILFAKVTPCMENGKVAVASGLHNGRGVGSTEFHVLRPSREISRRYLLFYLLQQSFRVEAERSMSGAVGLRRVPVNFLKEHPFPLPPLAEQHRIVAAIEDHISRLDAASRSLLHAQALIPLQRRALYTAATEGRVITGDGDVSDLLGERREAWRAIQGEKKYKDPVAADPDYVPVVPPGWKVFSLEALTHPVRVIRYGILMPKVKSGGTVPYVEVKDLRGCSLHGKELHLTSAELDAQFAGARIESGDILLAVRGSYDRSAVVSKDLGGANVSRDVARIAPLPGIDPEYLHIYLQSGFAQRYLKVHARGVAVKGVNIASIRALPVVVPSLATQMKIVEVCQQQLSAIDAAEKAATLASSRAIALRNSLLTRAFSGKLVNQDLGDEPAFAILDRIRTERVAQESNSRRAGRRPRKAATTESPPPPPASATPMPKTVVQQELPL